MEIELSPTSSDKFCVCNAFDPILNFNGIVSAQNLYHIQGQTVKNVLKERGTTRVFLKDPHGGSDVECYLKRYLPPSIKDRLKCALSLKPLFRDGALHEWDAICAFHHAKLKTMMPMAAGIIGEKTCNLTLGITNHVRASELFRNELKNDSDRKRKLIIKIANYAAQMHRAGLAHQDFYLVHFFVKPQEDDALYLIDLQRVIMEKELPRRWIIKDLAQIQFSLEPFCTSHELDLLRQTYQTKYPINKSMWNAVQRKSIRIQKHAERSK